MENIAYSGDEKLECDEYDSYDIANLCRVIQFNIRNFYLRAEEKGKEDKCMKASHTLTFHCKNTNDSSAENI